MNIKMKITWCKGRSDKMAADREERSRRLEHSGDKDRIGI